MPAGEGRKPQSIDLESLSLVDSEPGHFAFFAVGNMMVFVWHDSATGAASTRLRRAFEGRLRVDSAKQSHVHLVKAGAGLPTAEARAELVRLMHDREQQLANVAVCLLGSGFWASALQAAVTGMRMVAPRSFEMRIHHDLSSALNWLPEAHRERTGVSIEHHDLRAILNQACSFELRASAPASVGSAS